MSRKLATLVALAAAVPALATSVTFYSNPLTNANPANINTGANQSNLAPEDCPPANSSCTGANSYFLGDVFTPTASGTITSATIYAVSNNTSAVDTQPGNEFSSLTFYGGADGSNLSSMSTLSGTAQINASSAPVTEPNGQAFKSAGTGNTYPIYAITFTGLNWNVTAGQLYDFAIGDVPSNTSYTLALHATFDVNNEPNDCATTGNTAPFDNCAMGFSTSPVTATFSIPAGFITSGNVTYDHSGDINAIFTGTVPEPATFVLLGLGLAGLAAIRRRK